MGAASSTTVHFFNGSRLTATIECQPVGVTKTVRKGEYTEFQVEKQAKLVFTIKLFTSDNELVRQVKFNASPETSWIIQNDGISRQKKGASLSTADPYGATHRWQTQD